MEIVSKYLLRNDQWLLSPEYEDYDDAQFLMIDKNVNPIHEFNLNTEEKDFYLDNIKRKNRKRKNMILNKKIIILIGLNPLCFSSK